MYDDELGSSASAIDSSNVGFQLLLKCGWTEGTGLGVFEQGRLEPVQTRVKKNRRGLGSEKIKQKTQLKDPNMDNQSEPVSPRPFGAQETNVVQTVHCNICKIDCTSEVVFATHIQGKKHRKNLQKLQEISTQTPKASVTTNPNEEVPVVGSMQNKRKDNDDISDDLERKKRKVLDGGADPSEVKVCIVCNVVVNSQTVFESHIAGSKHIENVKKMQAAG